MAAAFKFLGPVWPRDLGRWHHAPLGRLEDGSADVTSAGSAETTTDPVPLAQSRLEPTGYATLRRVRCEFRDGLLRLSGCLPSQYLKQVAQAAVADVEGIVTVANEIEVVTRPANCEAPERFGKRESRPREPMLPFMPS